MSPVTDASFFCPRSFDQAVMPLLWELTKPKTVSVFIIQVGVTLPQMMRHFDSPRLTGSIMICHGSHRTIRVIDSYRLAIKLENKPGELLSNQNKQPSIHWLSQDRSGVHGASWRSHRGRVTSQAGSEMSQSLSPGRLAARSRHSVTGGSHCVSSTHSF